MSNVKILRYSIYIYIFFNNKVFFLSFSKRFKPFVFRGNEVIKAYVLSLFRTVIIQYSNAVFHSNFKPFFC